MEWAKWSDALLGAVILVGVFVGVALSFAAIAVFFAACDWVLDRTIRRERR